jgi:TRAP-type C4-dicarboxylate transport system permease small subunit
VSTIIRSYDAIVVGLAVLVGAMMGLMPILILYDVAARELGGPLARVLHVTVLPPSWAVPANEYSLLYAALLAAPWVTRQRGHVFIEIVINALPSRARRVHAVVVMVLCAALCAILAWLAAKLAYRAWIEGTSEYRSFRMPSEWLFGPAALGLALCSIEFLLFLGRKGSYFDSQGTNRPAV